MNLPGNFWYIQTIDDRASRAPVWLGEQGAVRAAVKRIPIYIPTSAQQQIRSRWSRLPESSTGLIRFIGGGFDPEPWVASEFLEGAVSLSVELERGPMGAIMYEGLAGRPLFGGSAGS